MAENKMTGKPKKKKRLISFRRDILGRVWFRLDYYDKRLMKLDEDKQRVFLDNYMEGTRQLNRSLVWVVLFMIISYMAYALHILNFAEIFAVWIILIYLIFYIAKRHRNESEKLLKFLMDTEVTPEYAMRVKKK